MPYKKSRLIDDRRASLMQLLRNRPDHAIATAGATTSAWFARRQVSPTFLSANEPACDDAVGLSSELVDGAV